MRYAFALARVRPRAERRLRKMWWQRSWCMLPSAHTAVPAACHTRSRPNRTRSESRTPRRQLGAAARAALKRSSDGSQETLHAASDTASARQDVEACQFKTWSSKYVCPAPSEQVEGDACERESGCVTNNANQGRGGRSSHTHATAAAAVPKRTKSVASNVHRRIVAKVIKHRAEVIAHSEGFAQREWARNIST